MATSYKNAYAFFQGIDDQLTYDVKKKEAADKAAAAEAKLAQDEINFKLGLPAKQYSADVYTQEAKKYGLSIPNMDLEASLGRDLKNANLLTQQELQPTNIDILNKELVNKTNAAKQAADDAAAIIQAKGSDSAQFNPEYRATLAQQIAQTDDPTRRAALFAKLGWGSGMEKDKSNAYALETALNPTGAVISDAQKIAKFNEALARVAEKEKMNQAGVIDAIIAKGVEARKLEELKNPKRKPTPALGTTGNPLGAAPTPTTPTNTKPQTELEIEAGNLAREIANTEAIIPKPGETGFAAWNASDSKKILDRKKAQLAAYNQQILNSPGATGKF